MRTLFIVGLSGLLTSIGLVFTFGIINFVLETKRGHETVFFPLALSCVALAYLFLPLMLIGLIER